MLSKNHNNIIKSASDMKVLLALLFALSLVSTFTIIKQEDSLQDVNWPFEVCGNGTWTMKSLTFTGIPSRHDRFNLTARGVADSETQLQTISYKIKLNGFKLDEGKFEFVQSLKPGDDFEYFQELNPKGGPVGIYEMIFNHFNKAGESNGCWSFTFTLIK